MQNERKKPLPALFLLVVAVFGTPLIVISLIIFLLGYSFVHSRNITSWEQAVILEFSSLILTAPVFILGFFLLYQVNKGNKYASKQYTKIKTIPIITIALVNMIAAVGFYPTVAYLRQQSEAESKITRIQDDQKRELKRQNELQEQRDEASLIKNMCLTGQLFNETSGSDRLHYYYVNVASKFKASAYRDSIQKEWDQAEKDCGKGIITAVQQKAIIDNTNNKIISDYQRYLGEAKFQESEKEFKEKQREMPQNTIY